MHFAEGDRNGASLPSLVMLLVVVVVVVVVVVAVVVIVAVVYGCKALLIVVQKLHQRQI